MRHTKRPIYVARWLSAFAGVTSNQPYSLCPNPNSGLSPARKVTTRDGETRLVAVDEPIARVPQWPCTSIAA